MNVPDKLISSCPWDEINIYILINRSKVQPSVRDIANELGMSKSVVCRRLRHLADLGYIGTASGTVSETPKLLSDSGFTHGRRTASGTASGTLEQRKSNFEHSLSQYVTSGQYKPEIVRAFSDYWTEFNKSRTKMRWELEKTWETSKRLATWANKDKQIVRNDYQSKKQQEQEEVAKVLEKFL